MAKQTNEFQQLIHYLYSQLAIAGAKVTESALLPESGTASNCRREIDVLLEQKVAGIALRIAVECRDHKKRDDIQWIDSLIGKYARLDVNKIVAVSNSGFSKCALEKASAFNIETKTLEAALESEWPSEFIRIGMACVTRNSTLQRFAVDTEPSPREKIQLESLVSSGDSTRGTLNDMLVDLSNRKVFPDLEDYLRKHATTIYRSLADIDRPLHTEHRYVPRDPCLLESKGVEYEIKAITVGVLTTSTVQEVPVKHELFGKALITSGSVPRTEGDSDLTIRAIQFADEDGDVGHDG